LGDVGRTGKAIRRKIWSGSPPKLFGGRRGFGARLVEMLLITLSNQTWIGLVMTILYLFYSVVLILLASCRLNKSKYNKP
jgi:hypothetical protein